MCVAPASHEAQVAQPEDEATEEHGLRSVAFEERLADEQDLAPLGLKAPRAFQQPAPAPAADLIAQVVADDRPQGGDRDHDLDLQPPAAGEHSGGDQRGLAGDRHAGRLGHHGNEQQRIAEHFDEVADVDRGRASMALPAG